MYHAELTRKVKERQPYMARFAHNWPIEEYIKRHHKNVCAYLKKLDDGTNATIPDINSEELSDVQEETASDCNMDIYFCRFMFKFSIDDVELKLHTFPVS